jgi:hypothetical protein
MTSAHYRLHAKAEVIVSCADATTACASDHSSDCLLGVSMRRGLRERSVYS